MLLMTAPVDSISPGSKLPFQPHFPLGSFLATHYSHLRFWAFPTDAVHLYATGCSFFSSCSAPTCLSRRSPSPVTLPKSIGKQSLPLLSFHSTSWICDLLFIVIVYLLSHLIGQLVLSWCNKWLERCLCIFTVLLNVLTTPCSFEREVHCKYCRAREVVRHYLSFPYLMLKYYLALQIIAQHSVQCFWKKNETGSEIF